MAVKPLSDLTTNWTKVNPLDQAHVKLFKNITNMPNFDLKDINHYEALNPDAPRSLIEDVFKRFPQLPPFYVEHPAFKVALLKMFFEKSGQLNTLDWRWHREALKQAREKEELHRIFNRRKSINAEKDRQVELTKMNTEDIRSYFFTVALENKLQQQLMFKGLDARAAAEHRRLSKFKLDLWEQSKWEAFLVLYQKELRPTKKYLAKNTKIARTEKTIAQVNVAEKIKITPSEFLLSRVIEAMPYAQLEEVQQIISKWTTGLGTVYLRINEAVEFKRKISKIFYATFATNDTTRKFHKQAAYQSVSDLANERKKNTARGDSTVERFDLFFTERKENGLNNKIQFDQVISDTHSSRRIINSYVENDLRHRKKQAHDEQFLPMTIEGITEYVQFHPVKFRTQYGIIKSWVNHVQDMYYRRQGNQDEVAQIQMDNQENSIDEINKSSLENAVELNRIMDASRVRYLFQNYTLGQMAKMFAATEEAATMMINYQKDFYEQRVNKVLDLQNSAAVHEVSKIKDLDKVS